MGVDAMIVDDIRDFYDRSEITRILYGRTDAYKNRRSLDFRPLFPKCTIYVAFYLLAKLCNDTFLFHLAEYFVESFPHFVFVFSHIKTTFLRVDCIHWMICASSPKYRIYPKVFGVFNEFFQGRSSVRRDAERH